MIKDKISNINRYSLNDSFEQLKKHFNDSFANELIFPLKAIPLVYDTKPFDLSRFEVHQKNIDIHYILEGEEEIGLAQIENLNPQMVYDDENDYQFLEGEISETVKLRKGEFLILYPNEAHLTAGIVNEKAQSLKKIVFKVPFI